MKYILIDTNRNSNIIDSEEKNNDFEKILISLKNDKDKIIKENQEKDKEIKKLKEFLTKKEKDTQKKSNNSSDSLQNEENVTPIRTLNNIHPEPLLPITQHKKSNSTVASVMIPKKSIPVITTIVSPINPNPPPQKLLVEQKDFKSDQKQNSQAMIGTKNKPLLDSPESQKTKEKVQVHSFNSVASIPTDPNQNANVGLAKNNKPLNKEKEITVQQSNQSIAPLPDNNPISKKTALLKSESNKNLVKLISSMEKKGSIKNIKTENKKRTSIIDNIPTVSTPFEVFKTLMVPKFSVVKKKIIMDSEVMLFEFRTLINDNKERVYRIEGYNLETAKAMKTAIMKDDVLKKVFDSINYEDILPLTHPLKSIFKYIDFVKLFVMPFIGVLTIS